MTRLTSALLALLGHASVEATTRGDPPANLPIGFKLRYQILSSRRAFLLAPTR
jgi:hypothetical protein